MSRTLNWLLGEDRYNKQVRPGFGSGKPVQIVINMLINTLGPVDETTQVLANINHVHKH